MFSKLLFLSIPISLIGFKQIPEEEFILYIFILSTQFLCVLNLLILDKRLQQFLHDSFVYVLTYGLLCSNNYYTKLFSVVMSFQMLMTRLYYKRCIFLFWNTTRNCDYDFIVLFTILTCIMRSESLLGNKQCMFIGIASHFLLDQHKNSFFLHIRRSRAMEKDFSVHT
jgi:hypothetical protein